MQTDGPMAARHLMTARTCAAYIATELAANDENAALRIALQSLKHFEEAQTDAEIRDFLMEPASTGDARWDTLVAAIGSWAANQRGVQEPAWTEKPPLIPAWVPATRGTPTPSYLDLIRATAGPEFLVKGILIRDRDIQQLPPTPPAERPIVNTDRRKFFESNSLPPKKGTYWTLYVQGRVEPIVGRVSIEWDWNALHPATVTWDGGEAELFFWEDEQDWLPRFK